MPLITLPDGTQKKIDDAVTVSALATSIAPSLGKAAIAGEVNGVLVDASTLIEVDSSVRIITNKDPEALEIIRHSAAHLLAQAVKRLYPDAQVTIGPVIEQGFFYDFAYERPFTPEDFSHIEKEMHRLVKAQIPVSREVLTRAEAIALFRDMGEHYKVQIIKDIPAGEVLSLYRQDEFVDLCRGPHVPNTKFLKAFKLTKLAGAYWRGDAKNEMLQRIYGTAFSTKDQLKAYLLQLEEAEKRDHRKLAKKMNLFHIQEEAPGMVFWHPNGWAINQKIRAYVRQVQRAGGYEEINTPQLADRRLWEKSGHWEKFKEDMFITSSENRDYAVKPMSCPCHIQVFKQGLKSYRDLPIRYAEFGNCHRNEPSGALHGLMRVRGFVQDDGHVFCTEEQVQGEVAAFIRQLYPVYHAFGFANILVKLSTRPENRIGDDSTWDKAEKSLALALDEAEVDWEELPGEGAFYGPKVEFSLKDCLGRVWQCGTIQLDFSMPARLGAEYVAEDNTKKVPVMLHRAMLGSFERFMAILLEEHAYELPLWLAPIQVVICNISDRHAEKSLEIAKKLKKMDIRVKTDLRNEKIGYKIREHTMARVPYLFVMGDQELENDTVSVRSLNGDTESGLTLETFISSVEALLSPPAVELN